MWRGDRNESCCRREEILWIPNWNWLPTHTVALPLYLLASLVSAEPTPLRTLRVPTPPYMTEAGLQSVPKHRAEVEQSLETELQLLLLPESAGGYEDGNGVLAELMQVQNPLAP